MNGEGSDRMRPEMSLEEVLWEGGMYTEQKVIGRGCSCGIFTESAMLCRVLGVETGCKSYLVDTSSAVPPQAWLLGGLK